MKWPLSSAFFELFELARSEEVQWNALVENKEFGFLKKTANRCSSWLKFSGSRMAVHAICSI